MNSIQNTAIIVRPAIIEDVASMVEVDEIYGEGIFTYKELKKLLTEDQEIACVLAVEKHGKKEKIVGFLMYEIFSRRFDVIALVAKDRNYSRYTTQLIREMQRSMMAMKKKVVFYVRERDLGMQLFLRSMKFNYTRTIIDWFQDYKGGGETCLEDAYRFICKGKKS